MPLPTTDLTAFRANPPANMSREEAALYLTVSTKTLQREVARRAIRPAAIGSRVVFTRAELDRYLQVKIAAA